MSLTLHLLKKAASAVLEKTKDQLDPDRLLQLTMSGLIETARARHEHSPVPRREERSGGAAEPIKLLLAGYVGTRNTGADVRVEEMVRQFRHLFGDDHLDLSILTLDPALTRGYFLTVKQIHVPQVFPKFLFDTIHEFDGVIACEGSMFKSKFASALSTFMVGAMGLATAEEKIAVGYGGEAGAMDSSLEELVSRYCGEALIICRNEASRGVLGRLGVPTEPGTDTAWTFSVSPEGDARAERLLRRAGWDGEQEIVAMCPINPFWWPVRPDPLRAAAHAASGAYSDSHYKSIYFHKSGEEVERQLREYLMAMGGALLDLCKERGAMPILVCMERLDRRAADLLKELHSGSGGQEIPTFVSDDHKMHTMVGLLRRSSLVASSRYHALVCSMPALVPSVGITMDERIRNLMADRGQPELALEVDDPELEEKLLLRMRETLDGAERVREGIGRSVVRSLHQMGRMGAILVDHVREHDPSFPFREELGRGKDPLAHLPPLSAAHQALLERFSDAASDAALKAAE